MIRLALLLAALTLCTANVTARADSFLYTLTSTDSLYPQFNYTLTTTSPISAITGPTSLSSSQFTIAGGVVSPASITLDYTVPYGPSGTIGFFDNKGNYEQATLATYTLAQYTTAGTYFQDFKNTNASGNEETYTLTVTAIPSVAAATTPEPSSVALLGTGLLGVAGFLRKRLR